MKHTFFLTQHSPIIHFHNHTGATLRATDVKPKFDKYLQDKGIGEAPLNYRLTFKSQTPPPQYIPQNSRNYPFFFGAMGDEYQNHPKYISQSTSIEATFFTFDKELLEAIKEHFPSFLAQNNFGTRSTKGYGSFTTKDFNESMIEAHPLLKFTIKEEDFLKALKKVEIFYKYIRQGINLPKNPHFYTKPLIFLYAKKQGLCWEKTKIKQEFFSDTLQTQRQYYPQSDTLRCIDNAYIVRSLLGLSTTEAWISYRATIKKEHPTIKRFASPLVFKPIKTDQGYTFYLWARKDNFQDFLDKTFTIRDSSTNLSFPLSTPQNFDLDDFLDFIAQTPPSQVVDQEFHRHSNFHILSSIYKTLIKVR